MKSRFPFLPALLAILLCFSCEKPVTDPEVYEYRFPLSYAGSLETCGFSLKAGDQVGLFLVTGTTLTVEAAEEAGHWMVKATSPVPIPDGTAVYPFYPYVADCTADGNLDVILPSEQRGDVRSAPLAGEPFRFHAGQPGEDNGAVCFRNLAALVDIRICSSGTSAGEQVESVYLRTTDGAGLAGKATARLTSAMVGVKRVPALTFSGHGSHPFANLTRTPTVATNGEEAEPNYVFVAPGTCSGTVTVVTGAATYSLPFTDKTFSADADNRLVIDLNSKEITRTALCNLENARVAGFLDAFEQKPYSASDYSFTYVTAYYTGTGAGNRLDLPRPVTVKWTNPAAGNGDKIVYIYKDPAMEELEMAVPANSASATSAEVYNLIPGRTWYYRVAGGGKDVASGVFKTTGRRRMIKVGESTYGKNHANNCRDFGGQLTASGKTVKYGKIFRGSNMDDTTPEAQKVLLDYLKVGLDVDLRAKGTGERGKYQLDALSLGAMHTTETYGSWANLSDKDRMRATLTKIFGAVSRNSTVYIHCKVGADRTGYVCMLLEALLGVPQNRCDLDYEMTSFSGAVGARTRTGVGNYYYVSKTTDGVTTVQGVDFINTFTGSTFQEKAVNYVTQTLGIPLSTITAFQDNMLE